MDDQELAKKLADAQLAHEADPTAMQQDTERLLRAFAAPSHMTEYC
jgi:hypothetical protein